MDEAVARLVEQPDAEKFSASRNLVIDIDPAFPWQITAPTATAQTRAGTTSSMGRLERQCDPQRRSGNL